jgi:hypothetical protein
LFSDWCSLLLPEPRSTDGADVSYDVKCHIVPCMSKM